MTDILDTIDNLTADRYSDASKVEGIEYTEARDVQLSELGSDAAEYLKMGQASNGQASRAVLQRATRITQSFSVRRTPWHELADVVLDDILVTDTEQILDLMGANWTIVRKPVVVDGIEDDRYDAFCRSDTGKRLSILPKSWTEVDNIEGLGVLDDVLGMGALVNTGGTLDGGARVWVQARVPNDIVFGGTVHAPLMTWSTAHDGTGSVRMDATMVNADCTNSLRIGKALAVSSVAWRHTKNVRERMAMASQAMGVMDAFTAAYTAEVEALLAKQISEQDFREILDALVPVDTTATARVQEGARAKQGAIRSFYSSERDGGKFRGTAWGVLNAVNGFSLWASEVRPGGETEDRARAKRTALRVMKGGGDPLTNRAMALLG